MLKKEKKLHRHRPQIEKVSETLFHPASAGRSRKLKGSTCARSARNCRFPEIGTPGCQPWNHRLPLQGTAGSQKLELLVPNVETVGYHCKELPFLVLLFGPVQNALLCLLVRCTTLSFAYWPGTECFVLFNGPVQDVLFCLLVRYRMLCFWLLVRCMTLCFAYWSSKNVLFC